MKGPDHLGALQFGISDTGCLFMAAGRRNVVPAGAHHREVGAGKTDVAQQVIVELHQVGEDPLPLLAAEHGRQAESHFDHLVFRVVPGSAGGLCPSGDERLMNCLRLSGPCGGTSYTATSARRA